MVFPSVGVVDLSRTAAPAALGTYARLFRRTRGLEDAVLFVLPES
jgi:hypothetical protein